MFESFLNFLKDLSGERSEARTPAGDDPAVAAAALLFHVIEADGVRGAEERARLEAEIASGYGLEGARLAEILAAQEAAEKEAVDLYSFTSVLKRHLDSQGRIAFVGMMWEIVYADGVRDELEDNVVWRVAELMGVDSRHRIEMRRRAAGTASGAGEMDER
jgi:uncharacterized tellurite resistance protein B-like protein